MSDRDDLGLPKTSPLKLDTQHSHATLGPQQKSSLQETMSQRKETSNMKGGNSK